MRLPRDLSASQFIKLLEALGYTVSRQSGSHIRLTTLRNGEHHVTIPNHASLRLGTLNSVAADIAEHLSIKKSDLMAELFGK